MKTSNDGFFPFVTRRLYSLGQMIWSAPKILADGFSWFNSKKSEFPNTEQGRHLQKALEPERDIDKLAQSWAYASFGAKTSLLFVTPLVFGGLGLALGATFLLPLISFVLGLSLHGLLVSHHEQRVRRITELVEAREELNEGVDEASKQLTKSIDALESTQKKFDARVDEFHEAVTSLLKGGEDNEQAPPLVRTFNLSAHRQEAQRMDEELSALNARILDYQKNRLGEADLVIDAAVIQRHREALAKTDELLARAVLPEERATRGAPGDAATQGLLDASHTSLSSQQEKVKEGEVAGAAATGSAQWLVSFNQSLAAEHKYLDSITQSQAEHQERMRALADTSVHQVDACDEVDFLSFMKAELAARTAQYEANKADLSAYCRFFGWTIDADKGLARDEAPTLNGWGN